VKLVFTRLTSLFPEGHFIQWSIQDARESGVYLFTVYRSGGADGPWELLAQDLSNQYAYVDKFPQLPGTRPNDNLKPNQLRLFRNYYYRVDVRTPSNKVLTVTEEVGTQLGTPGTEGQPLVYRKMGGYHRKALRDLRLSLKFNGTPVALLKRRIWGERCPKCFDKISKEVMRAACTTCWGTGFIGGFWNPSFVYARRGAGASNTQITPEQKSDSNDVKVWMPDVPAMERDDLIVFLDDNRRFRIDQQIQTEIKLTAVHQQFSAQEIEHSNIVYRLPVNTTQINPLF
jgi:hypothetical protein